MSNYPPGVTGRETQIGGDSEWERWIENLQPGDPLRVERLGQWYDGRFIAGRDDGDADVEILVGGRWVPVTVQWHCLSTLDE